MFERDTRAYYERRWAQATELGDQATHPKIAAIHYELALRYAISSVRANEPRQNVLAFRKERAGASPVTALLGDTAEPRLKQALEIA